MSGRLRSLKWIPAPVAEIRTPVAARGTATSATAAVAAPPEAVAGPEDLTGLIEAIAAVGVPTAPGSVRDEAVALLEAASEVEHLLLVQYLYAAYSIDTSKPGAPDWQSTLIGIAREEMGHLVTVQNLLLLLGEEPYLGRDEHGDVPGAPFPFRLEPLSRESLARYVVAESPVTHTLPPELADLSGLLTNVDHVGVLYAKIYWLFQSDDSPQGPYLLPPEIPFPSGRHLSDADLAAGHIGRQTAKAEWGGPPGLHVDHPTARDAALAALSTIAIQGEGVGDTDQNSHFHRFLAVFDEVTAAGSVVALPVPTDPATTGPTALTDPDALRWAHLFDQRYELLLLDITLGLSYDAVADKPLRRLLMHDWAVENEMQVGLAGIARHLTALPAASPSTVARAGATFGMPAGGLPTASPAARKACWQRQLDLIDACRALIDEIGLDHDDELGTLSALRTFDEDRRASVVEHRDAEPGT